MSADSVPARHATAFAAVVVALLLLACAGPVPTAPPPVRTSAPPPQPKAFVPPALWSTHAFEVFDMGEEGEAKYKGKVVQLKGKVDVQGTKRPAPGGTTAVVMQGEAGDPPYAIATIGQDSEELLLGSRWQPAQVTVQGTYRERDARGTILLDNAKVLSLTSWMPAFATRRKPPTKPPEKAPKKPPAPIAISAEKLAQELHDDLTPAYKRYGLVPLQVQGVVHKQAKSKTVINLVQFKPAIKDRKTGKPVEFIVFCGLRPFVPIREKAGADLAVGKKVTLRGTVIAAGNGQVTLTDCQLVPD